jgi:hypothetical protein
MDDLLNGSDDEPVGMGSEDEEGVFAFPEYF